MYLLCRKYHNVDPLNLLQTGLGTNISWYLIKTSILFVYSESQYALANMYSLKIISRLTRDILDELINILNNHTLHLLNIILLIYKQHRITIILQMCMIQHVFEN